MASSTAREVVNVLCMKWGTKYSGDYVNTLYSMVARNMTRDFRFICLTEDGSGLNDKVEVFPLPELSVDLAGPERGWNKLAVFAETLYDLK
ncbi:MAG: glycosyltransferase, partial [Porticoccaceae bacterium]